MRYLAALLLSVALPLAHAAWSRPAALRQARQVDPGWAAELLGHMPSPGPEGGR